MLKIKNKRLMAISLVALLAVICVVGYERIYKPDSELNIIKKAVSEINAPATYSLLKRDSCQYINGFGDGGSGTLCRAEADEFYAGSGNMQQDFNNLQQKIISAGFGPSVQFSEAESTDPLSATYYTKNPDEALTILMGNPSDEYLPKSVTLKPYPVGYVLDLAYKGTYYSLQATSWPQ